jgi:hypothetical protein
VTTNSTSDLDRSPATQSDATDGGNRTGSRPWVLSLDFVVYVVGTWTLGFWCALALGRGWIFALLFAVAIGAGLALFHRRAPIARLDVSSEWTDSVPIAVVLALVVGWPVLVELGRTTIAVVVVVLLGLRIAVPLVQRSFARVDARLLVLAATALVATLAYWASWSALVVVLYVLVGVVLFIPRWTTWLAAATTGRRLPRPWVASLLLGLVGALIATWWIGIPFWGPDNTYYLNKALHYAASPNGFSSSDLMFGVDGAVHYPAGDLLSSFEPLLGAISGLSSVSAGVLLFRVAAPLSMLAIPFAVRYAARGLGLRRANLAGAFAGAAILLMSWLDTYSLFAQASTGKTIGRLVFIPILLGVMGDHVRRKDASGAVKATLAVVAVVGFSPSLALPAGVIVAPFTVAGLWDAFVAPVNVARTRTKTYMWLLLPIAFLGCYSLVAQFIQTSAGESQSIALFSFASGAEAWESGSISPGAGNLTVFFVIGATALFPLLAPSQVLRRGAALTLLFLFGVLLAPWTFDLVLNRVLDLNYFAWRFVWALPVVMLVGLALAHLDLRRRLGLVTVVAFTLALGLSPPQVSFFSSGIVDIRDAPLVWPWEADIPDGLLDPARQVVDATPVGGRFLAPAKIEEVATGMQIDRFPTYARMHYIQAVGGADSVPADFFPKDRLALARAMAGQGGTAVEDDWRTALTRVQVDTVCMDETTTPRLRAAVMEMYTDAGSAGPCQIWVRRE